MVAELLLIRFSSLPVHGGFAPDSCASQPWWKINLWLLMILQDWKVVLTVHHSIICLACGVLEFVGVVSRDVEKVAAEQCLHPKCGFDGPTFVVACILPSPTTLGWKCNHSTISSQLYESIVLGVLIFLYLSSSYSHSSGMEAKSACFVSHIRS